MGPRITRWILERAGVAGIQGWQSIVGALLAAPVFLVAPVAAPQEPEPQATGSGRAATEEEPAAEPRRPPADSEIEEIVVMGAESESASDFEAADSVTGFGAEDLAALGAQDIADLAEFTPNLEIVTSGATTPTFFIRGVGLNDFNPNSTGSVAVYQDDVVLNAPALQLGALYDTEAVNVLRGPQGTGLARNASAGAIKIYSRKPTGEFGGFLRSELGNFGFRDFEGAVEAPIWEDLLAGRFAFRFSERDGTMKNRCGDAPPIEERDEAVPGDPFASSICGEKVERIGGLTQFTIPEGLPTRVNDIGNWAARGTLLFQPTLDMTWLINAHGSRRDEWSRLGQSYGTGGFFCLDGYLEDGRPGRPCRRQFLAPDGFRIENVFAGRQFGDYQTQEVQRALVEADRCQQPGADCTPAEADVSANDAKQTVAGDVSQTLDSQPWAGDFNMCTDTDRETPGTQCQKDFGRTINDTWGGYLKGDIALPGGVQLTTITGYDTYDRLIDIDLDFSPATLFQIRTEDEGWQVVQDLRFQGQLDEFPMRWDAGGGFLREELDVSSVSDLEDLAPANPMRDYTQDLWSAWGYVSLFFDFWERFTLDGGFRYNWEQKQLDFQLSNTDFGPCPAPPGDSCFERQKLKDTWQAPTGMVRLTYRFREDTHVFWKYTRGWKPGTYNATSGILNDFFAPAGALRANVTLADPETIDAFETGVSGSWIEGRLGVDFSLFYYNYENYQIFTAQQFSGAPPEFVILNANNAEVYGSELDLVGRPWPGAFLNVRFGWLESQFLDFVQLQQEIVRLPPVNEQRTVNRELQNTGNQLLNSPRFKVSLTAEQMLPLGRFGSLTARYDGVWTDTTFFDATEGRGIPNVQNIEFLPKETIAQPAFWLHNLRLSYRVPGGQVELAAWVRNLLDTPYKTFGFDGSTFSNTTIFFVGDPRTFGGTLNVSF